MQTLFQRYSLVKGLCSCYSHCGRHCSCKESQCWNHKGPGGTAPSSRDRVPEAGQVSPYLMTASGMWSLTGALLLPFVPLRMASETVEYSFRTAPPIWPSQFLNARR